MQRVGRWLIIVFGLATLDARAHDLPSLVVTPQTQQIEHDSSGYVRIRIENVVHLHAYNMQISWNPLVVRCRRVRGLGFFDGQATFFAGQIDSINGRTTVNEAVLGTTGQSGSGDLCELRFFGLANGTSSLVFTTTDLRDTSNGVIPVTVQDGVIQVGPPSFVEESTVSVPDVLHLQNYPNPFNPATTIRYSVDKAGKSTATIYSISGSELFTMSRLDVSIGENEFIWDGKDTRGNDVPSGVYIVRLQRATSMSSKKMLLAR